MGATPTHGWEYVWPTPGHHAHAHVRPRLTAEWGAEKMRDCHSVEYALNVPPP